MFTNKLRKTLSSIFSGFVLFVTFGIHSPAKTDAKIIAAPTDQVLSADREVLDSVKDKVQADYRRNIAQYESHDHPGKLNG